MLNKVYYTVLFYGSALLSTASPGILAWKLFRETKGKIPLLDRDLICDAETLLALPKSDHSLDENTTAFSPFIPLLTLNGSDWKKRRQVMTEGLKKLDIKKPFALHLPLKKGDIYWDIYHNLFHIGFELIFGRKATQHEQDEIYPGIADINRLIKRQQPFGNEPLRQKAYRQVAALIQEERQFILRESEVFQSLNEIDQVSLVAEDLMTSICIQCTDLVCHLLLFYASFPEPFKANLDYCIQEALRLYPLTDIWTKKSKGGERGWIASLTQLNRNGWSEPDTFLPHRWESDHPPFMSWGFNARGCPASHIGYSLSRAIFMQVLENENIMILPASNFTHERTFPYGCQVWIGKGATPLDPWKFKGKWKGLFRLWFCNRIRALDQAEFW